MVDTAHDTELARTGYPVPPGGGLTDPERTQLARYGHWMSALAAGRLAPATDDQRRFVAVAHGEAEPGTPFEWAWVKLQRALHPPGGTPAELSALAQQVERAREAALAAQLDHADKRQRILAKVQAELDALDAAEADRLRALDERSARLTEELKEAVLRRGHTFAQGRVKAVYYPGRVTYDAKAMQEYAKSNPDVDRFKKVSKPFVQMRFADDKSHPPPAEHEG